MAVPGAGRRLAQGAGRRGSQGAGHWWALGAAWRRAQGAVGRVALQGAQHKYCGGVGLHGHTTNLRQRVVLFFMAPPPVGQRPAERAGCVGRSGRRAGAPAAARSRPAGFLSRTARSEPLSDADGVERVWPARPWPVQPPPWRYRGAAGFLVDFWEPRDAPEALRGGACRPCAPCPCGQRPCRGRNACPLQEEHAAEGR
jgi:hypothetical protein